ncbi:MAG: universal stress protein [Alphaproteobacteria bacterium]|nr:universal stress protein [Alphaproteobacteria bacterium]
MFFAGVFLRFMIVVPGDQVKQIPMAARAVESEDLDLLVMGAHGHSRVRGLIIGSTTTGMVRSCKIPIALCR